MRVDVVIGNPPYQEDIGSGSNGCKALYNLFIDNALVIADIISFIVPSRWMSDKPNGIENNWLSTMRERYDFVNIVDFADSSACFNGVSIAGGVCYFIIDRNYQGNANIKYIGLDGTVNERVGKLSRNGIVIRNQKILSIVEKVNTSTDNSLYQIIGTSRQFSPNDSYFNTNWDRFSIINTDKYYIKYFASSRIINGNAYICEDDLPCGTLELVKIFKMFLPLTGPTNNQIINIPFIGGTNSCCSRTYAPMYGEAIDNEEKALNCIKYWKTKFLRILVSAIKTTQHASRSVYMLVPLQDFTNQSDIDWSKSIEDIDRQLYKKYNINEEEVNYIEKYIKPME